jgi:hypothetical protein
MLDFLDAGGVDAQIELMVRFIQRNGLAGFLDTGSWAAFAARYNGPGYRRNAYDTKLAAAFARWTSALAAQAPQPDAATATRTAAPTPVIEPRPAPVEAPAGEAALIRPAPATMATTGPDAAASADALADLVAERLAGLLAERQARLPPAQIGTAPAADPALAEGVRQNLDALLRRLAAAPPASGAVSVASAAPSTLPPAVLLTPIDQLIGGTSLMGSKTTLAVVGYTLMSVLQAVGVLGTATGTAATPTGLVLTLLAGALGSAGLLSKGDRAIRLLGLIAAK